MRLDDPNPFENDYIQDSNPFLEPPLSNQDVNESTPSFPNTLKAFTPNPDNITLFHPPYTEEQDTLLSLGEPLLRRELSEDAEFFLREGIPDLTPLDTPPPEDLDTGLKDLSPATDTSGRASISPLSMLSTSSDTSGSSTDTVYTASTEEQKLNEFLEQEQYFYYKPAQDAHPLAQNNYFFSNQPSMQQHYIVPSPQKNSLARPRSFSMETIPPQALPDLVVPSTINDEPQQPSQEKHTDDNKRKRKRTASTSTEYDPDWVPSANPDDDEDSADDFELELSELDEALDYSGLAFEDFDDTENDFNQQNEPSTAYPPQAKKRRTRAESKQDLEDKLAADYEIVDTEKHISRIKDKIDTLNHLASIRSDASALRGKGDERNPDEQTRFLHLQARIYKIKVRAKIVTIKNAKKKRYKCRKRFADTRKRVGGRFVRKDKKDKDTVKRNPQAFFQPANKNKKSKKKAATVSAASSSTFCPN